MIFKIHDQIQSDFLRKVKETIDNEKEIRFKTSMF